MEKRDCLVEGLCKQVFNTDDEQIVLIHYTDRTAAYNNLKKATLKGKGLLINQISAILFRLLRAASVPTHYIETVNEREQLCRKVQVFPLEVIVRNIAAGSLVQRLGFKEGTQMSHVVYNLHYNNKMLDRPLINDSEALALGLLSEEELKEVYRLSAQINTFLIPIFKKAGIVLVDMKVQFGRCSDGTIVLAEELTPENCRLWDLQTARKLDKDRFRRDMGNIMDAYQEVYHRLLTLESNENEQ